MYIHRADERGLAEHGWLQSRFSFSFAEYHDMERMGFGVLRVINDDIIGPGQGFGMHPHRDMEIITVVTRGVLEHRDSEGHHGLTKAGEIQYMSAGSGIHHSEYNASGTEPVELFQIWIRPNVEGAAPRYDQRDFNHRQERNRWVTLVSPDGRDRSMAIRQDATISMARLEAGGSIELPDLRAGHGQLLFVVEGAIEVGGDTLGRRDEAQFTGDAKVTARAGAFRRGDGSMRCGIPRGIFNVCR